MAIETYFEDIADAIRERGGTSATLTPAQMPQAILDIPGGGGSSVITPDFSGIAYGYIATNGTFYAYNQLTEYITMFTVSGGIKYGIFIGETVSNRRRCAFFANKTANDFLPYLTTSQSQTEIYSATEVYAPDDAATDDTLIGLRARIICTPQSDGIIIFFSSNNSTIAPAYCVNLST